MQIETPGRKLWVNKSRYCLTAKRAKFRLEILIDPFVIEIEQLGITHPSDHSDIVVEYLI